MKEKKTHSLQLLIRAVVRDPDGKIITDTGQKPARSFAIQFLEFFYGLFRGVNYDATDTGGGESGIYRSTSTCGAQFRIVAGANLSTRGMVVGTGNTAETNTDYVLEAPLIEGTGVGEITYGEQVIGTTAVVGPNVDLEIKRAFTNNTGLAIDVNEVGAYAVPIPPYLIIRDVFPGPVNVPDKYSLTVIYTLRTTV